ncbi:LCP family protein required for cell wall assembly [Catenulispora sp. EB89]|uniref:LCP family protein n=1 Tax=Catenulispora sp. EB89 TaxID=3156257 RepID=UPI00351661C8
MAAGRAAQIKTIIALCSASLLLTVGGAASYVYLHLNGNIETAGDLNTLTDRPKAGPPVNILLLGSQTRDGQTGQFGGSDATGSFGGATGTDLSDTSMLLHVSGDRKYALVVSIPRDTIVNRPPCPTRDGTGTIPGQAGAMFDASMSLGGPLCTAATVEQFFGVRVDHFVRLDFNGFRKIVTYLGGVEVCIPPGGIDDPYSHLNLPAGRHVVTGDEALAFVRDRHGIGDGSDLGRIEMQKMFLTSLITKIEDSGTLADAGRLYQLADITTSSITTDQALGSVSALLDLAGQVQGLKPHDINFITLPTVQDPNDPNRVDPAPSAQTVWGLINADQSLPTGPGTATASPATPSPTASPAPNTVAQPSGSPSSAPSLAPSVTPSPAPPTDLKDRPADTDICSDLPQPNNAAAG